MSDARTSDWKGRLLAFLAGLAIGRMRRSNEGAEDDPLGKSSTEELTQVMFLFVGLMKEAVKVPGADFIGEYLSGEPASDANEAAERAIRRTKARFPEEEWPSDSQLSHFRSWMRRLFNLAVPIGRRLVESSVPVVPGYLPPAVMLATQEAIDHFIEHRASPEFLSDARLREWLLRVHAEWTEDGRPFTYLEPVEYALSVLPHP